MIYLYVSTAFLAASLLMLAVQFRRSSTRTQLILDHTKRLEKELQAAAHINQVLGDRLIAAESEFKRIDALLQELQEFGKNDLFQQRTFKQAGKMAQLGASVDELKRSCELSQGEAELLSHMHQLQQPGVH
jgi:Flp pilus assembly protein TadB